MPLYREGEAADGKTFSGIELVSLHLHKVVAFTVASSCLERDLVNSDKKELIPRNGN